MGALDEGAAGQATAPSARRVPLALVEVLDRDGLVRQSAAITEWPLRVGRALDNDLVLDDVHSASHHFSVAPDEAGDVVLRAGESLNGLRMGTQRLGAGEQRAVGNEPVLLTVGRTALRLRLASHELPPEQPLLATRTLTQGLGTLGALALAVVLVLLFELYVGSEPEGFVSLLGSEAISNLTVALGWTGLWTLLSKVFTRQGHFGWHLRVLLIAVLVWKVLDAAAGLLAFSLSWPWVTDFLFVPNFLILGAMLYFHLQAVEPHHPRRTRALALASVVLGIGLSLWSNLQNRERAGSELYMGHLFPPALRLARPVATEQFLQGVAGLQATLDDKAKKEGSPGDDNADVDAD